VTSVCLHSGHVFIFEDWARLIHILQKVCPQFVSCGSRSTCKQMGQLVGKSAAHGGDSTISHSYPFSSGRILGGKSSLCWAESSV